jgi:hypothetical protein
MTNQTSLAAVDNLKRALFAAVDRYRAMSKVEFVEALVGLCKESQSISDDVTMQQAMTALAAAGSIDAVAALVVMGSPDEVVIAALKSVVQRSEDAHEGVVLEGLTIVVEEWLDDEIAAGRMVATIDPATGKKIYSSKGPRP